MTPANDFSTAAIAVEQGSAPVADIDSERPVRLAQSRRVHAVPVGDTVASSGWLAEALYRVVEFPLALIGLIVALPVMLIEAALIRWDSPGPALFFHTRPGRS